MICDLVEVRSFFNMFVVLFVVSLIINTQASEQVSILIIISIFPFNSVQFAFIFRVTHQTQVNSNTYQV